MFSARDASPDTPGRRPVVAVGAGLQKFPGDCPGTDRTALILRELCRCLGQACCPEGRRDAHLSLGLTITKERRQKMPRRSSRAIFDCAFAQPPAVNGNAVEGCNRAA